MTQPAGYQAAIAALATLPAWRLEGDIDDVNYSNAVEVAVAVMKAYGTSDVVAWEWADSAIGAAQEEQLNEQIARNQTQTEGTERSPRA